MVRPIVERLLRPFQQFFSTSAAGSWVLLACTAIALIWANSPWQASYHHFWEMPVGLGVDTFSLVMPVHAWVNDGMMSVFFLLVGLEIKREVLIGELSSRRSATLPVAAAMGGMIVPALLYASVNATGDGAAGWGIPMATDIAFALGILALLGSRVPASLRVFLAALAIADDLGAVLVIAVFYTHRLDWMALAGVGVIGLLLAGLNRGGVRNPWVYSLLGCVLWWFMLKSGVHATIAGVLLAMSVPASAVDDAPGSGHSPLLQMEHTLQGVVAFVIMPVFALANAGVSLGGNIGAALSTPIAIGVSLGLLVGKPVGITLASYLAIRSGTADLPTDASWRHMIGISCLAGIGFTMSLFIANLAFGPTLQLDLAKVAVIAASTLAGIIGVIVLRGTPAPDPERTQPHEP